MLICVPDVLTKDQVATFRRALAAAEWVDGRVTAGTQSALAKANNQLPENSAIGQKLGEAVLAALAANPLFLSAALPLKIFPPMFNRYAGGQHFGVHVDNAIRAVPGTPVRIRTDLSATLFLTEPEDYAGGDLIIEDQFGGQRVKLPAGHMVLYPSTSLHQVTDVTRGERLCSFFWLQSMVRDDGARTMLFDLDQTIQELAAAHGLDHPPVVKLTGIYHNLMRRWATV